MPEQALLFGAIADDDTGASDEAGMLSEAGARTILSMESLRHRTWRHGGANITPSSLPQRRARARRNKRIA
jgi:uncharacterized protein YgbK (DUF1537 family)